MDEPGLDAKRCSWCGTMNSARDRTCSKCDAVLPTTQSSPVETSSASTKGSPAPADENQAVPQDLARRQADISLSNTVTAQTILSLGLGPRFVSGQTRAYVVVGFLSIFLLISLFAVRADFSQIELLSKAVTGKVTANPELIGNLAAAVLLRLSILVIVLLTGIAFLAWIYRAHQNLRALGALDLNYSPGWAIGGFLIPVLNLFRPFQVVTEIWKASGPETGRSDGTAWRYEETPLFIGLWWGSWLLSGFLNSSGLFMTFGNAFGDNEADALLAAARFRIAYDMVSIACAVLAILVVLKINDRQESTNRIKSVIAQHQATEAGIPGDQL